MSRKITEFHLIVSANPKAYSNYNGMYAGELAGSVSAHCLHLEKEKKVIYHANIINKGIAYLADSKKLQDLIKQFGNEKTFDNKKVKISKYGFFYEAGTKIIKWIFEAEGLKTYREIYNEDKENPLKDYLPYFQREGIKERIKENDKKPDKRVWLLIKNIRQLAKPIQLNDFVLKPKNRSGKKLDVHVLQPNAYVTSKTKNINKLFNSAQKLKSNKLMSDALVEVIKGKKKFREIHVHNYFLYYLKQNGCYIKNEGKVIGGGRFDVFYRYNNKNYCVEFKLDADDNAPKQLKGYIDGIKKKNKLKKVNGIIICHNPSQKLCEEANKYNYEVLEYSVEMSVPGII